MPLTVNWTARSLVIANIDAVRRQAASVRSSHSAAPRRRTTTRASWPLLLWSWSETLADARSPDAHDDFNALLRDHPRTVARHVVG
jgi:hypothetical protein